MDYRNLVGLVILAAVALLEPKLLLYAGIPIVAFVVLINAVRGNLSAKGSEKWGKEREARHLADPKAPHEEAIELYAEAKRVDCLQRTSPRLGMSLLSPRDHLISNHPAFRPFLLRNLGAYVSRFTEDRIEARTQFGALTLPSASEMKSVFDRTIAADRTLDSHETEYLRGLVSSKLRKYLDEEAEARARSDEQRQATEAENARQAKAAQTRREREQRMLSVRLGSLYSSAWNTDGGRLPLEDALKAGLPKRNCVVYRVIIGGESYVGYTTATLTAAMDAHVFESRLGGMEPLHKMLRRFGYVYETEVLDEAECEVDGLLARLGHINRLGPKLNRSFEGDGEGFSLIEQANEFGEMAVFVENKRVSRARGSLQRRSDAAHMRSLIAKVERRYARLGRESTSSQDDVHGLTTHLNAEASGARQGTSPRAAKCNAANASKDEQAGSVGAPTSDDVLSLVRLRKAAAAAARN